MGTSEHVVQVYHDEQGMRHAVGEWLAPALRHGGGALLACTPAHAEMVRAELRALGVDVDAHERAGRFVARDAEALLRAFMVDGAPHAPTFHALAEELISGIAAASAGGAIRVWGEMVDLLAKRGEPDAAQALEVLWNEVLARTNAQLLCSYELDALHPTLHARVLMDVCETHTDVVPQGGPPLEAAVWRALDDEFGPGEAEILRRVLPTRPWLLERMSEGQATLVSLRRLHPELGERVARRAREHLAQRTS